MTATPLHPSGLSRERFQTAFLANPTMAPIVTAMRGHAFGFLSILPTDGLFILPDDEPPVFAVLQDSALVRPAGRVDLGSLQRFIRGCSAVAVLCPPYSGDLVTSFMEVAGGSYANALIVLTVQEREAGWVEYIRQTEPRPILVHAGSRVATAQ